MRRWHWIAGAVVMGLLLVGGGAARADRTPTARTSGQKSTGARRDITVPYTTDGTSAFMGKAVAPRIYASPDVDDPRNPQAKPVYNLQFYGSVLSFGDRSTGAKPRATPLTPRP